MMKNNKTIRAPIGGLGFLSHVPSWGMRGVVVGVARFGVCVGWRRVKGNGIDILGGDLCAIFE